MKNTALLTLMLLFIAFTVNSQNTYVQLWQKVEKLEVDNLPKSAVAIVNNIYKKATREQNSPQLIKSLFYKSKFSLILEEDAQLKVIHQFKHHIAKSSFPTKNVLENILANLYWQYFQQNRYKFYRRTATKTNVNSYDFRTWDLATLFKEIHFNFNASLNDALKLQELPAAAFAEILQLAENQKTYSPTVYDFLANNALNFYKSSENSITRPSYKFTIDTEDFIKDVKLFSSLHISSKDSISLELHALKTYQNLITFHLKEHNLDALTAINIARLHFVNSNATFRNKDQLLLNSFKTASKKNKKHAANGLYLFEIAKILHKEATSDATSKIEENRFKNREALEICRNVIDKFPKSLGAKKCLLLKKNILKTALSIKAEEYVPTNSNSRILVSYKNLNKLYFTAYKVTPEKIRAFYKIRKSTEKIAFLNTLEKGIQWNTNLKNETDYLLHTTEVVVPKFKNGTYLILASEAATITTETTYGVGEIKVTNLALITNSFNGSHNYQVLNRNNGAPIKNAEIFLTNEKNNRNNNGAILNKRLITDTNGLASFKPNTRYNNVSATVKHKDERALFGQYYLYNNSDNKIKNSTLKTVVKPFIFTDRSIYRPGQTVYFKAIAITTKGTISRVYTNTTLKVLLKDVNNQEVGALNLKLNDYGAISGAFILPNNGLSGNYSIEVTNSVTDKKSETVRFSYRNSVRISVEEYKRPKFKTAFKEVKERVKINDTITIHGLAEAFSGAKITAAKVVYNVHRKVQYPSWYYWRGTNYTSEKQQIVNGETTTDTAGNFKINFKAVPDATVSKENLPVFNYEITADVTDLNGETRSATTTIKVGYHSLIAEINMAKTIDKNKETQLLQVETKNLNGAFIPAEGSLKIYKLLAPKAPLRQRPWSAPDYQDISKVKFQDLFPHDAYSKVEENERNWATGDLMITKKFNSAISKEIKFSTTKDWPSGAYIAILKSTDSTKQTVTNKHIFSLYAAKEKQVADNKLFTVTTNKKSYLVHDVVALNIGSASKDITIMVQVEKNHKITQSYFLHLNNNSKTIKIPIEKEDLGGFAIKYHFVNYNYFKSGSLPIHVIKKPRSTIAIETNIFRDKLQPGAQETWSFTLKNDKNNAVAAELLASMYDASLDEFKPHEWNFNPIPKNSNYYSYETSAANRSFGVDNFYIRNNKTNHFGYPAIQYGTYNWFGFAFGRNRNLMLRGAPSLSKRLNSASPGIAIVADEMELEEAIILDTEEATLTATDTASQKKKIIGVKARKNFKETAFFYPNLRTDKNGKITFSFTMPEALTTWKLQLLAHTKDLQSSIKILETVTQKELMVVPNVPRFLREGDTLTLSAKISNLTNNTLRGVSKLVLTDALTGKNIDSALMNLNADKNFTVAKEGNTNVFWTVAIPETVQAIQYKIVAKAGSFSDGEQNVLPVLSNRLLVTETLPMWVRSNETRTFTLDKLKDNTSTTLKNHNLTLEITSNPVWYAIQSLPYLMEYPYDCAEQTFSKFYANTLASFIANSNPKIQEVFNSWKTSGALVSNLEKNEELKSLILQETPWLRDAVSESEQKKRIALLFDLNKIKNEQENTLLKLKNIQMSSGGFPWFKGGRSANNFITQHIATGFGHLKKLGAIKIDTATEKIFLKTVSYLDSQLLKQYVNLQQDAIEFAANKNSKAKERYLAKNHLNYFTIQYLYMRSFYSNISINTELEKAINYYSKQSETYWNKFNLYGKGQIALSLFRKNNKITSNKILASLKENAINSEELGMYWKSNTAGSTYYQAPIETQALLIAVFSEIAQDTETIDNLKVWLLKNKQTSRWPTTKATTEAVYALLLTGNNWISNTKIPMVTVGNKIVVPKNLEVGKIEAGTGYFKTSWKGSGIEKNMATVNITQKAEGVVWGGLYWQYFEDLDKITKAETSLKINKKLFIKVNSETGKELQEVTERTPIQVGDLITTRIELQTDRDLEFIHMKDMRASGLEPVNILSAYKWQDNLGYYESTRDAATNFFFEKLPKGIYVFEYDTRVNSKGNFSNGITTVQSMYAPEFSSHSKGIRLNITN